MQYATPIQKNHHTSEINTPMQMFTEQNDVDLRRLPNPNTQCVYRWDARLCKFHAIFPLFCCAENAE